MLSFYPGYQLYKFLRLGITAEMRSEYVVSNGAESYRLDSSSNTVSELNERVPVVLDESTILDYLHFYCAFSHGRHGRFHLVETVDDLRFVTEPGAEARGELASLIRPIRIRRHPTREESAFAADCTFFFDDALIACEMSVSDTGRISPGAEVLLRSDLQAKPVDHVT